MTLEGRAGSSATSLDPAVGGTRGLVWPSAATIRLRRRASGLSAGKTFDAWDEHASPIPKATQHTLRTHAPEPHVSGSAGTHVAIDSP